jgi:hypothetical protein
MIVALVVLGIGVLVTMFWDEISNKPPIINIYHWWYMRH